MPKITNPVIMDKIRAGILAGKPEQQVLREAGFAPSTVKCSVGRNKAVKIVKSRIKEELTATQQVTVEYVLDKLLKESKTAPNAADRIRATELLGKFLSIFSERIKIEELSPETKSLLSELSLRN